MPTSTLAVYAVREITDSYFCLTVMRMVLNLTNISQTEQVGSKSPKLRRFPKLGIVACILATSQFR